MRTQVTQNFCKTILLPALAILALEGCTITPFSSVADTPRQPATAPVGPRFTESADRDFRRHKLERKAAVCTMDKGMLCVEVELLTDIATKEIVKIMVTNYVINGSGDWLSFRIRTFEPLMAMAPLPAEIKELMMQVAMTPEAAPEGFELTSMAVLGLPKSPLPNPREFLPHGPPPSITDGVIPTPYVPSGYQ